MRKKRIQVLYEHGWDFRPFSSSYIRLLRPLSHPALLNDFDILITPVLLDQPTDFVFLDRLWTNPEFTCAENLIKKIHSLKAKLIYFTDDDLSSKDILSPWHSNEAAHLFKYFIHSAYLTVVSTERLKSTLSPHNTACIVIPNFLDERLIVRTKPKNIQNQHFTVGYMGTPTHNADLELVLPALIEFQNIHNDVTFEFMGVNVNSDFSEINRINELRCKFIYPSIDEIEYPLFMLWWTSSIKWDLAIAPLQETEFNLNKSDIKLLDYAAIGAPAIFTDILGYQSSVPNRGLLAPNATESWLLALETLYENHELRDSITAESTRYLFSERILNNGISKYNQFLKQL